MHVHVHVHAHVRVHVHVHVRVLVRVRVRVHVRVRVRACGVCRVALASLCVARPSHVRKIERTWRGVWACRSSLGLARPGVAGPIGSHR